MSNLGGATLRPSPNKSGVCLPAPDVLFTKTKKGVDPTPEKKTRNRWYRTLGVIMLACIVLIPIYNTLLDETSIAAIKPVFLLESIALWAFGWSWAIKGDTLFKDPDKERATA